MKNPDKWTKKHVKRPGLRKNSPRLQIDELGDCGKQKCLQKFSISHLNKVRENFESMYYEEQNTGFSNREKSREHMVTHEKLALLLVQKGKDLEGHQQKIALSHTTTTSEMKKE